MIIVCLYSSSDPVWIGSKFVAWAGSINIVAMMNLRSSSFVDVDGLPITSVESRRSG